MLVSSHYTVTGTPGAVNNTAGTRIMYNTIVPAANWNQNNEGVPLGKPSLMGVLLAPVQACTKKYNKILLPVNTPMPIKHGNGAIFNEKNEQLTSKTFFNILQRGRLRTVP